MMDYIKNIPKAAAALCFCLVLAGCGGLKQSSTYATVPGDVPSILSESEREALNSPAVEEPTAQTEPEHTSVNIDLVMVGDILAHEGVYKSGYFDDGTVNFDHIFANVKDDIQAADIAIVNQEVVLGGIELGLSGYPCFNSPYELGDALVNAGFNVVLHATNHALDKGITGIDNTLNFWRENHPEIAVLGIHDESFTDYSTQDIYVYEQEGVKIAILNYTYGTNGIAIPQSRPLIVNLLDEDKIKTDVARAKELADFVVVCPHWGTEYVYTPDSSQEKWTQLFYDLGVDLVIGTHPHVIEPVEWITSPENDHKMLVYYSLGNFVSNQSEKPRMLGAMAKVTITMDTENGEKSSAYISDYSVEPLVTHKLFGPGLITTYNLSDYSDELAAQNRIRADEGCSDFSLSYLQDLCRQVFKDMYKE
jgi:poly-gamma-glutamate synthesis protein (capsule biosynthesis protein)